MRVKGMFIMAKRISALFITLILLFSFSAQSFAAPRIPVYKVGNVFYFFNKDTATITGFAGEPENLVIPSEIAGHSVVSIGASAFYGSPTLKSVVLPEGISTISANAFSSCPQLERVEISSTVTYIGPMAFANNSSLAFVTFRGFLDNIADDAFYNTAWMNGIAAEFVILGGTTLIRYNGKDETVTVPAGVKRIAESAFAYNSSVKEIILPEGLQKIGDNAFVHCYSLEKISIPSTVSHIGAGAFDDTIWLRNQAGEFVSVNGILLTYRGNKKHIEVPQGVTGIGSGAFLSNENLRSVKLPESIIYIDSIAFGSCSNLLWVNIPDSVEWIDETSFLNCSKLTLYGNEKNYSGQYAKNTGINFSSPVYVKANNKEVEFENASAVISYERTFVPLRDVAEKLGFTVSWDIAQNAAICTDGKVTAAICADGTIYSNGEKLATIAVPLNINGSMLVSVRVLCEAIQADVTWDEEARTVNIIK